MPKRKTDFTITVVNRAASTKRINAEKARTQAIAKDIRAKAADAEAALMPLRASILAAKYEDAHGADFHAAALAMANAVTIITVKLGTIETLSAGLVPEETLGRKI